MHSLRCWNDYGGCFLRINTAAVVIRIIALLSEWFFIMYIRYIHLWSLTSSSDMFHLCLRRERPSLGYAKCCAAQLQLHTWWCVSPAAPSGFFSPCELWSLEEKKKVISVPKYTVATRCPSLTLPIAYSVFVTRPRCGDNAAINSFKQCGPAGNKISQQVLRLSRGLASLINFSHLETDWWGGLYRILKVTVVEKLTCGGTALSTSQHQLLISQTSGHLTWNSMRVGQIPICFIQSKALEHLLNSSWGGIVWSTIICRVWSNAKVSP